MTIKVAKKSPFLVPALLASTLFSAGYDYEVRSVGFAEASAISNDGRIAACSQSGTGHVLAGSVSQWSLPNKCIADVAVGGLAVGGSAYRTTNGVSNLAQATFSSVSGGGVAVGSIGLQAVEWTGSGSSVALSTSAWPGGSGRPYAISPNGRYVVGYGIDPVSRRQRAVVWDRQQVTFGPLDQDVQQIGGGNASGRSFALDVNDHGVVVGTIGYQAVRWVKTPQGWTAQHLGPNLTVACNAESINRQGTIVGTCHGEAFIWQPGAQELTRLQSLVAPSEDWLSFVNAYSINNIGQIVGKGRNAQGQYEGFVITPKSACIRPCTFSDGVTLRVPLGQCNPLGGTSPVGTHECIVNSQSKASSFKIKPLGPG